MDNRHIGHTAPLGEVGVTAKLRYAKMSRMGTVTPGNYGDFLVLDAGPLVDISKMRKIATLYIGGRPLSAD